MSDGWRDANVASSLPPCHVEPRKWTFPRQWNCNRKAAERMANVGSWVTLFWMASNLRYLSSTSRLHRRGPNAKTVAKAAHECPCAKTLSPSPPAPSEEVGKGKWCLQTSHHSPPKTQKPEKFDLVKLPAKSPGRMLVILVLTQGRVNVIVLIRGKLPRATIAAICDQPSVLEATTWSSKKPWRTLRTPCGSQPLKLWFTAAPRKRPVPLSTVQGPGLVWKHTRSQSRCKMMRRSFQI